jgi:hypothetical protein
LKLSASTSGVAALASIKMRKAFAAVEGLVGAVVMVTLLQSLG